MPLGAKIKSAALAYILSGYYLSMIQALLTDYFACPKFELGLSETRSFWLQYFTNHWHLHTIRVTKSSSLAHFEKLWIQYSTATLPIHPLTHLTNIHLRIHSSNFSITQLNAIVWNFPDLIPPIPIFFQSLLHIYLISIQSFSRKFIISFSLLKTSNAKLNTYVLSFWISASTNLALISLIS